LKLIKKIQKNYLFKVFSSVKMAVFIMVLILIATAIGTIVESRYNAELASLYIYAAPWFNALLFLVGILVINATIARLPWKKRHTGFLITHLGIVTLLIGAYITQNYGIDGILQVEEGRSGQKVFLSERVFEYSSHVDFKKIYVEKKPYSFNFFDLRRLNQQISDNYEIMDYKPFVAEQDPMLSQIQNIDGFLLQFNIKSAFFDQDVSLHSRMRSELQMGPAVFKVVTEKDLLKDSTKDGLVKTKKKVAKKSLKKSKKKAKPIVPGQALLEIYSFKSNKLLATLKVSQLSQSKAYVFKGISLLLKQKFNHASIEANKIVEANPKGPATNPALELTISQGKESLREVIYTKFDGFTLNAEGAFNYKFKYKSDVAETLVPIVTHKKPKIKATNVVQFVVAADQSLKVQFIKNNKIESENNVKVNEEILTPWMGMKLKLSAFVDSQNMPSAMEPKAIVPKVKEDMTPPSALQVKVKSLGKKLWITEGQVKSLGHGDSEVQFFYGRNSIDLPFNLNLKKFYKKDYPGTETPMSFESHVTIDGGKEQLVISMNEPMKLQGYTLYQSSYQLRPGGGALSIFSVNRDPGRSLKYLGSVIMSIGIIIITLMKSRLYNRRKD
jgi:hypothetical protein